jgi:hypothetical protein
MRLLSLEQRSSDSVATLVQRMIDDVTLSIRQLDGAWRLLWAGPPNLRGMEIAQSTRLCPIIAA